MIVEWQPYHLDPAALTELGLGRDEVDLLVAELTLAGDLTADLTLPADRVAYFFDVHHALEYTVEGFSDQAMDVFFLLHAVAQELSDGAAEIIDRLEEHAATQRRTVFTALQDGFGIPAETVEAACRALCGDVAQVLDDLRGAGPRRGRDHRARHGRAAGPRVPRAAPAARPVRPARGEARPDRRGDRGRLPRPGPRREVPGAAGAAARA